MVDPVIIHAQWVYLSTCKFLCVVVGLCLGGVVHGDSYFPCKITSDCPGTCYFNSERPICGEDVINGYLARICICVGQYIVDDLS